MKGKKMAAERNVEEIIAKIKKWRKVTPDKLERLGFVYLDRGYMNNDPCGHATGILIPEGAKKLDKGATTIYYTADRIIVVVETKNECDISGYCYWKHLIYVYPPRGKYYLFHEIYKCGPDGGDVYTTYYEVLLREDGSKSIKIAYRIEY